MGLLGVTLRQNTLVIYMSLELMLNAVNLAFVAFSRYNGTMDGNLFVFFIITVAAAEVALRTGHHRRTVPTSSVRNGGPIECAEPLVS